MGRKPLIGWSVVGVQFLLIAGAVVLSGPQVWNSPAWAPAAATALAVAALVLAVVGVLGLGKAATATPVPREVGDLRTDGVYGLVRHPIYTGVLTAVGAWALASGAALRIVCWLLLVVLFVVKSRWEERMLVEKFPAYAAYCATTPPFIPRWRRSRP